MKELASSLLNLKLSAEAPAGRGRPIRDDSTPDLQASFERSLAQARQAEDRQKTRDAMPRPVDRRPEKAEKPELRVASTQESRQRPRQEVAERDDAPAPARSESAGETKAAQPAHEKNETDDARSDQAHGEGKDTADAEVAAASDAQVKGEAAEGDEHDPALMLMLTGGPMNQGPEPEQTGEGGALAGQELKPADAAKGEREGVEGGEEETLTMQAGVLPVALQSNLQVSESESGDAQVGEASGASDDLLNPVTGSVTKNPQGLALKTGTEGGQPDAQSSEGGQSGQNGHSPAFGGLSPLLTGMAKPDTGAGAGQDASPVIDGAALKSASIPAALTTVASPIALQAVLGATPASSSVMTLPGNLLGQGGAFATMQSAVGSTLFGDELAQKMSLFVGKGVQTAQLILNPAELGPIEIKLHLHKDQAQIQVQSSVPMVRELVEASSHRLRDMLAEQGVELSRFDVGARHSGQERGGAGQGREQEGQGQQGAEESGSAGMTQTIGLKSDQLVDFYA